MKHRLALLALALGALFAWTVFVHARLVVDGRRDPRLVRFMRRHDRRSEVSVPAHAVTLDRAGRPLVLASGTSLYRAADDLAVLSGGGEVRLSLDAELQSRAEELMKSRRGAVVALEPTTGKVRVLVSSPTGNGLERALEGLYPPGSVFKVFMAAAALDAGLEPVFDCPPSGYRSAPSTPPIRDVEAVAAARSGRKWRGFGKIGMGTALAHSSNVYFARLGVALGGELFSQAVERARLRDSVTLLSSAAGRVEGTPCGIPDGVSSAAMAPVAIGQGALQMTPLAVAMFTAAVADDGVMVQPTLLESGGTRLRARAFGFDSASRVKKMMRLVVTHGTARSCDLPGLEVCGKTGTAQTGRGRDHSWFTCFAPAASPRLALTVLVEEGGFGAGAALSIARELLQLADRGGMLR